MEDRYGTRTLYADEAVEVQRLRRAAQRWRMTAMGYASGSPGEARAMSMAAHFTAQANRLARG